MAEILIVEDELSINELIRKNLSLTGHHCTQAFDGKTAAVLLENGNFDLLVLDIMLPGLDGYQVFERACGTPTIFLTAKSELSDKLKGLSMGADDYMTKPFQMLELAARVEAVLRRTKKSRGGICAGRSESGFWQTPDFPGGKGCGVYAQRIRAVGGACQEPEYCPFQRKTVGHGMGI